MKVKRSLEKLSSSLLIISMVLSLFASPAVSTAAVVRAQAEEPTPVPTEVVEPTPVPEEPTAVPEEPTLIPEEPTAIPEEPTVVPEEPTATPEEPTLEPTNGSTLEPTQTPTLLESASPTPTPTITVTPTQTELPEVVPLFGIEEANAIPDQYIVVYKDDNIIRSMSDELDSSSVMGTDVTAVESLGGTIEQTYTSAFTGFAAKLSPSALKQLRKNPLIDYIKQDQIVSINDDIEINTIQNNATWGIDRIDQISGLDGNYTYYLNGTGVHAYVIDTGILASHPEFGGRAVMDFDAVDGTMSDCNGHGTHVAGTIGGSTYGVAKNVTLHGVRVLNCSGKGSESQTLAGIDWVMQNHQSPAVVNMSLGGSYSDLENTAVAAAIASGITFVVAAGNSTDDACYYSPASAPSAITVGATDLTDSPAHYSNYGSCLDIFAPGSNITSAWYTGGYNTINGTSMASPHVAGAVALLLQANPGASPANITSTLLGNAVVGKLNNMAYGSPNKMLYTKPLPNPTAPKLTAPVVGASMNDTTPTFTWNTVTGATQYRIQIANSADFETPARDELVSDAAYTDAGLPEGVFYWRVMSKNAVGIESLWSDVFTFVIDTTAPDGPSLTSPSNGAAVNGTPTLEWNAVSDATGYMLEIDDSFGFSAPVVYSNPTTVDGAAITSTSMKPSVLAGGATYYWHVRSRDAAGNWGSWSSTRSFTTDSPVPQAPQLSSPASGTVVNSSTPTLSWNAVDYGARYEVQISSDPTFINADFERELKNPGILSHVPASGMTDAIKYYWRVHALNTASVAGPWSEVRHFIIDTTGPAAPVLNLPVAESLFVGIPTFTWTAVATANAYQFQYSTDGFLTEPPAFSTSIDTPITTTSYKDMAIPTGVVYTWRVRARDAYGNWGDWSATRWVNVQASLPPAPVVTVPVVGVITNNPYPDFAWNAVTGAATYEIQIDNLSTFASPEIVDSSATNAYSSSSPLPADGLYYYRVRAVNATGGPGAWSVTRSLTLDTIAPGDSVLISPLNAATPVGTPTFTWTAVSGANAYQYQYSTDVTFTTIDYSSPGPGYPGTPLAVTSHKPTVNMTAGIPYYWHVRARDAAGNWGEWTFSRLITVQAALPGVPVVTAPAIGLLTNNTTPAFIWNVTANAATYDIQIDNISTFISPEIFENTAGTAFTPSIPLPADGIYYWRVRAVNATGGAGAWSAARAITLDTAAPAAPVLSAPVDGATPIGTPVFVWVAVTGANAYQFQYSADNTFTDDGYITPGDTIPGTPLTVTSHKPTLNMTVGTTYYWRSRARDAAGNWGDWSAARTIIVQATLPGVPVVTAPAAGLVTNNTTPTFVWNAVTGAAGYDIQIDNLSTFASPEVTGNVGTNTFTPSSAITPDAVYYYRVRAINATGGAGAWSAARGFTLDTTPPAAPVLYSPLDAATPVGTPSFVWIATAGANAYQFQYSQDNTFAIIDYSTPGDTYPGTPLVVTTHKPTVNMTVGTTYYWRARARDLAGNWGVWTPIRSIITQAALPAAPVVTAPAISSITNNPALTFTWNAVTGAASYDVQIDNQAAFASPEATGNVATNSFTPSSAITPDGLYYYRIRAINATGGIGPWSVVRAFTLDTAAPAAPVIALPVNGATPIGTPTFIWSAAAGANAYQFQYSSDAFASVDYSTAGDTYPGTPLAVTSHKPSGMTMGTTYSWRVRARDMAGNWGDWSTIWNVIPQATLPPVPVITAPANGLVTNNTNPVFSWNAVTSAISYDVQIDNQSTFASPEVFESAATNSFTPASPIAADGLYYWRVRSVNITGGAGAWSAVRALTVDTTAPAAPSLTSPLDGATPVGTPIFGWAAVPGANAYQYEYSADSGFSSIDYTTPGEAVPGTPLVVTSHKPAVNMVAGTPYYWHARARDAAGNWGDWSAARSIIVQVALPGVPVVTAPANGFITNNTTPTFAWNAVTGAVSYDVQIDNLVSFASPEVTGNTATNSFTPSSGITPDGLYYYRVRAVNATGGAGLWSAARYFTLDTLAPAEPNLSAPINGVTSVGNPSFIWGAVTGANAYEVEVALTEDFASPVSLSPVMPIAVTSYKPVTGLSAMQSYYWHVRARDVAGNWGEWSTSRTVSIVPPVPSAPVLLSPATGIYVNNNKPVFSWNSVLNAESYRIQVSKVATFATTVVNATTFDLTYQPGDILGTDGPYYWRVQAINAIGQSSAWSAARTFTLDTVGPAAPVLTGPAEGTILAPGIPTFTWAVVAGATAYQFQMDDFFGHIYNTPGGPASEFTAGTPITVTYHKPTSMTPAVLYYWRARARDGAGNWGAWSNYHRVVEQAPLPVAPTLSSPADKSWTTDRYPTFTWNSVPNAVNYEIQVDVYSNFISLDKTDITLASGVLSWTTPTALYGDQYWRVRGINVNGLPGPWSAVRRLSTEFTSTFDSDAADWVYSNSEWILSGGSLVGVNYSVPGYFSYATYDAIYSDFTFETRMSMDYLSPSSTDYVGNIYGVFVHAGPSSPGNNETNGYLFLIAQGRDQIFGDVCYYGIIKITNSVKTSMTGKYWLGTNATYPGEWTGIKVVSNGSTLGFYINGMLIKSIANAGPKFGKVGVLNSWLLDRELSYLDYAYLSPAQAITATSATASSTVSSLPLRESSINLPPLN